jgi:phospholipase/lecithinase/hemolysin
LGRSLLRVPERQTDQTNLARNFLIMGLPPTDRTPLVQTYSESVIMLFKSNLLDFNGALYDAVTTTLSEQLPEIVVALYDTQPIFNDILDNPTEYGFSNVTGICDDYVNITAQPDIYSPECYYPVREF